MKRQQKYQKEKRFVKGLNFPLKFKETYEKWSALNQGNIIHKIMNWISQDLEG